MSDLTSIRRKLLAHLETCRPDTVFHAGLLGLAGAVLAAGQDTGLWQYLGAWAVPTLGWIASLYGGDYFDRELDAVSKPLRPIPSGRMSAREAAAGMYLAIVVGLMLAVLLNPLNLAVVAVTAVLGVLYSWKLKGHGFAGNLVRGGPAMLAFLVGMTSVGGEPRWDLLPFGLVFWVHDTASNLLGALCDQDGDRAGGYQTHPVRHGDHASLRLLGWLCAGWIGLACLAPLSAAEFRHGGYLGFLAVSVALTGCAAAILLRAPRPVPRLHALRAHEIVVIERLVLSSAVLATALGVLATLWLLVPALAITALARLAMRRRDHATRFLNGPGPAGVPRPS
ncbi:UbiA family prenyltransferase [Crossiella cryophila]|uniref:4-hydroxybenzoate polyprenyltransferase/geranylgeranylglycerol-phosphate geranylgeranyltransferase n=1 Tax=Crossiella cryophila TaxID=43355 RepID=A0A7W7FWE7_9PSEU|nr:UbiA family prenyltransferase [Crossiella cryophila]MBB4681441.1 4-hydroxybenzoate polyprenyltransferase/geranylgeranylglycerol-phosphate geranylgeranyltransferase [Crossiella cryophila]